MRQDSRQPDSRQAHVEAREASRRRKQREGRAGKPSVELLEGRWMPSLTVQFANGVGVQGTGSVDVESNGVTNDAAGNVYVTGSLQGTADFDPSTATVNLTSTGDRDAFLAKYDKLGNLVWAKDLRGFDSTSVAQGTAIAVDSSGNVIISGTFTGTVNFDPNSGNTSFSAPSRNDVFVAKYDSSGNVVWARDVVGTSGTVDEGYALAVDGSGNIAVGGSYQSTATFGSLAVTAGGNFENFITLLNSAGQFQWVKSTIGSGSSVAQTAGVAFDLSGNIITTGFFSGTVDFDPGVGVLNFTSAGSRDIFVQKLSPSGNLTWAVPFGSVDIDQGNSVAVDSAGNVYVTGVFASPINFNSSSSASLMTPGGFEDAFLLKLNSSGQYVWAKDFSTTNFNAAQGTGVALDATGHVFVAGYFQGTLTFDSSVTGASVSSAGGFDVFVTELDTAGNYVTSQREGGANYDADFGIGVNTTGQVAIAGRYSGPAAFGSFTLPSFSNKSIFIAQIASATIPAPPPAPGVPTLSPSSDTGVSNTDGITNATAPVFIEGTVASSSNLVELLRDGTVVASRFGAGPLTDPGPVPDGTHLYTARQTDAYSQVSPLSGSTTVVVITKTPPTPASLTLNPLDDSGVLGDGITNVRQPRLTGTATANTTEQLLDSSGTVLLTSTTSGTGAYTFQFQSQLSDGTYAYRVREQDIAGNLSAPSASLTLVIDATPPAAPSIPALLAADDSGTLGDGITNVKQPRFTGTTGANLTIQLVNASGTVIGMTTANANGAYSVKPGSPLSDGTYSLHVQAVDVAGNISAASGNTALVILSSPPAAPSTPTLLAADDSGTLGDGITNVKQPHLIGTAVTGTTIQLLNASGTVLGTAATTAGGTYSVAPATAFADGTYVLHVQATDVAGNVSAVSGNFSLTIASSTATTPTTPVLLASDDSGIVGDGITNVNKPHLTGVAAANVTAQLLDAAGNILATAATSGNGAYSLVPTNALADGTYVLHVQTVDLASNVSPPSGTFTLTIDTVAPAAPSTPSLLASDDSGIAGDGITNVKQPHLTGTAPAGTTVQLLNASGAMIGFAGAGAGGAYSVTPSTLLADGTYVLHTQAFDAAGNLGASSGTFTLVIASVPPAAPSTPTLFAADDSGVLGDGITNVKQPHLTGTAPAGTTVQLVNASGSVIGTVATAANGTYTVTPSTTLADGTYALHTQAVDVAGNVSAPSGTFTLVILTAAPATPSAPSLLPADDSGVLGDGITNVKQPRLTGTAASGLTVQLVNGAGLVIGTTVATGGAYTVAPSSQLVDGTYLLHVQAVDAAGNISTSSGNFSLTIASGNFTTPTTPVLLSSDDSGIVGDGITNVNKPHLTGVASANVTIRLIDGSGNLIGSTTTGPSGAYSVTPTNALADGGYTFRVQAQDVAGNSSAPSGSITITIDTTAPAAPSSPALFAADDSATLGDGITNVKQPRFTGSGPAGLTVQLINGAGTVLGSSVINGTGGYTLQPTSPFADGTYAVRTQTVDVAGNVSVPSAAFSVTILTAIPATPSAPTLLPADDSGAFGDNVTNVRQPRLTGTSTPGSIVQIVNGSGTVLGVADVPAGGTYTVSYGSPLADGTYKAMVRVVDVAGNVSLASASFDLTIDGTAPAAPSIPILAVADDSGVVGDSITNVRQPHFTGTAEPGAKVQLATATGSILGSAIAAINGTYSVAPISPLADGTYSILAFAIDAAGNTGAISGTFSLTINGTPPAAPSTPALLPADDSGALGDGITNVTLPHLTGTTVPFANVQLILSNGTVYGSGKAGSDGSFSIAPTSPLATGGYLVHAQASDVAGNVSAPSANFSLTISTASNAPATPSTPVLLSSDDSGTTADGITNIKQPHLTGTGTSGTTVQLLDAGGNILGSAAVAANGTYSVQLVNALADGTYVIRARAVDNSNMLSAPSAGMTLTIDTTAPAAPSTPQLLASDDSGVANDGITNVRQPRLTGTAERGATVQLLNAGTVIATAIAAGDGTFTVAPAAPLADGSYTLTFRAIDAAGNVGSASNAIALTILATPPGAPTGPVLLPADDSGVKGDGITNVTKPHLTGTGKAGATAQLVNAGRVLGTAIIAADGTFTVQPTTALANGTYALQVNVVDVAGNVSPFGPTLNLTIQAVPVPSAPKIQLLAADAVPSAGTSKTVSRTPHLTGNATPSSTITLYDASGNVLGTTTASATDGSFLVQPSAKLPTGANSLSVRVSDIAGNTSTPSTPATVTVMDAAPADFNGDGITDLGLYRKSTSQWITILTSGAGANVTAFGYNNLTDIPVPADYDGIGKSEFAIFRPSTGQWVIQGQAGIRVITYGAANLTDIPVPGDYDGVGYAEPAVFRPSTGQWFVLGPNGGHMLGTFGYINMFDIPAPGDYDGVGHTEMAVYRPSTAQWIVMGPAGPHILGTFGQTNFQDIPIPGDYDGVGHTEMAVYRPSTAQWFVQSPSGNRILSTFGLTGLFDIPVTASISSLKKIGNVGGIRLASISAKSVPQSAALVTTATTTPTTQPAIATRASTPAQPRVASVPRQPVRQASAVDTAIERLMAEKSLRGL